VSPHLDAPVKPTQEPHRADEILQDLVRDAPGSAEAHCQLGRLYEAGGRTARARTMFRKAATA
jgi:Tfp pilus assembly protein PilF